MHLDNSFISLLSAEESCYFKVVILGFFFALVVSILPESCLEVKEGCVLLRFAKILKNSEFTLLLGTRAFNDPRVLALYLQQNSEGLVRSRMIKSSEEQQHLQISKFPEYSVLHPCLSVRLVWNSGRVQSVLWWNSVIHLLWACSVRHRQAKDHIYAQILLSHSAA